MIEKLLGILAGFIIATISSLGYAGIVLLMAIESACIPLPSEIIMPFSGYLVFTGELQLWLVALAGAIGCVLGSLLAYWLGAVGGRPLVEKYGRYVLISHHDLDLADRWFQRHGDITIFIGRLLPVVRTFIAFPAGIARMPLWRFNIYTFVGSFIWCWVLAWIGKKLGQNWNTLGVYFHRFDALIGVILLVGLIWYVRRHLKHLKRH
jgi:membrane protein DedA with SNARE-associated domain